VFRRLSTPTKTCRQLANLLPRRNLSHAFFNWVVGFLLDWCAGRCAILKRHADMIGRRYRRTLERLPAPDNRSKSEALRTLSTKSRVLCKNVFAVGHGTSP
jgi:hypothetical protein